MTLKNPNGKCMHSWQYLDEMVYWMVDYCGEWKLKSLFWLYSTKINEQRESCVRSRSINAVALCCALLWMLNSLCDRMSWQVREDEKKTMRNVRVQGGVGITCQFGFDWFHGGYLCVSVCLTLPIACAYTGGHIGWCASLLRFNFLGIDRVE